MRTPMRSIAVVTLFVSGAACAEGGGTLYHDGTPTRLSSVYAYAGKDPFDANKPTTVLVACDVPIDAAALDASADRKDAFDKHYFWNSSSKATCVALTLGDDKDAPVREVQLAIQADTPLHQSGSLGRGAYQLELKQNDGKRLEGSFRTTNEADKKKGEYYDLAFAVNVAGGPPFGPGLPPDGGAPFKAYEAYAKALFDFHFHDGHDEMQEVVNAMSQAQIKQLNTHKGEKRYAYLKDLSERNILQYRYVGGHVNGDVATLEIVGKDREDKDTAATVSMRKEDGDWYFDGLKPHAPAGGATAKK